MAKFFITYGNGTNLRNCFSIIEAEFESGAREILKEHIENKYAFIYTADEFAGQVEQFGLEEVPLQPQVYV